MTEVISDLIKDAFKANPEALVIVVFGLLLGVSLFLFIGLLKQVLKSYDSRMEIRASSLSSFMSETRAALHDHQDYMDSAIKDFKRTIDKLKEDISDELKKLSANAHDIEAQTKAYAQALGESQSQINKRLKLVEELKNDVALQKDHIARIDSTYANVDDLSKLYEIIKAHNEEIRGLKKKP